MMKMSKFFKASSFFAALAALTYVALPALVGAQNAPKPQGHGEGLDPADILKPLGESWPIYSGDYSGKRYSSLTQINQSTVKNLGLAWVARITAGPGNAGGTPTIVGGLGGDVVAQQGNTIRGAVLSVNGILYFS